MALTSRALPQRGSLPGAEGRGSKRKWIGRLVFWGALVIAWQVAAASLGPLLLPGLQVIATAGISEVAREGYYFAFLQTLQQLVIGFGVSCAVAIPLGALVGRSKVWADLLQPYAYGIYVTPKEALLPLLIILFGTDLQFQVAVVVLFSSFFPFINTAAGVAQVDRGLTEAARSLCTPRWRFFRHVLLPSAMPYVVAGVRLGLGMAFNAMVIAELWIVTGMGGILTSLGDYHRLAPYFALTGLVAAAAIGSYAGLGALERRLRVKQGLPAEGNVL